jgi:ribonuclease P protein component
MTTDAPAGSGPAPNKLQKLRWRRDFLRAAASGVERQSRAFKLQTAKRPQDDLGPARFGFTVTKKIAGAVGRNRIRRRLKEALRISGALVAREGHDYVFVARRAALTAPFPELSTQIADGLALVHERGAQSKRRNSKDRPLAP